MKTNTPTREGEGVAMSKTRQASHTSCQSQTGPDLFESLTEFDADALLAESAASLVTNLERLAIGIMANAAPFQGSAILRALGWHTDDSKAFVATLTRSLAKHSWHRAISESFGASDYARQCRIAASPRDLLTTDEIELHRAALRVLRKAGG